MDMLRRLISCRIIIIRQPYLCTVNILLVWNDLPCLGILCAWTLIFYWCEMTYPVWAYYALGRQCRCQEDSVSLPSGRLEKTTRSSPHHVAQHRPTGPEKQHHLTLPEAADLVRIALCGGWCRRMVLCNLRVACQKWRRHTYNNVVNYLSFCYCLSAVKFC